MLSNRFPAQAPPRSIKRLSILGFFCLFFVALIVMLAYYYGAAWDRFAGGIEEDRALIVMDEILTHTIFLTLGLAAGIIFCLSEFLVTDILGRQKSRRVKRFQGWCGGLIVLSIVFTLFGGLVLNPFWHSQLEQAGYEKCSNNVFLLSKSFGNSAWVKSESWCHDARLSEILRKHHNNAAFDKAARYLRAKYVLNQ